MITRTKAFPLCVGFITTASALILYPDTPFRAWLAGVGVGIAIMYISIFIESVLRGKIRRSKVD